MYHVTKMDLYASPSNSRLARALETRWLGPDESAWTGRRPTFVRTAADVPLAVYLNYAAPRLYAARLAPALFKPLPLSGGQDRTLFTILCFQLERARPHWAPASLSAFVPRIMQSNWRFYGHLTEPGSQPKPCVFFARTVTTSLALAFFGRRLARCFPLRRARAMRLEWSGDEICASIDPGAGSAPALHYAGGRAGHAQVHPTFQQQFSSFDAYARWIIDQHISIVRWPREYVVQDMHLDFGAARIIPLTSTAAKVEFIANEFQLIDAFAVEGLKVFLDNVYARPN
jgi:Uncharacterized conserved protein (COG2071)